MDTRQVLVVDDEPSMVMALAEALMSCGYRVDTASDGMAAMKKFRQSKFDVVITDMRMPKMGGMDLLREIKKTSPQTHVIVITAYGTVNTAVQAMKGGASDFIMKPFSIDDIESVVRNVLGGSSAGGSQKGECAESNPLSGDFITNDAKMKSLLEMLKCIAKSKSSVLIQGESGTGKELIARYIHRNSNRCSMPFVAVNCAAVPHNLLESEMFGYEKGAFTGASQRRLGKFELANGGTLLLDEVSEMDIQLQAKLLRAIQEGEIDRLGGKMPTPVDVRIISTTNSDLKNCIIEKKFREDLYYRLNVIPVKVPPLRERINDIPFLCEYFIGKYTNGRGRRKPVITKEAISMLKGYSWPGNVRELENIIERATLITDDSHIKTEDLFYDSDVPITKKEEHLESPSPNEPVTLWEMERNLIFQTLKDVNGNKTKASKILGISVRTMRNKLHEYGVSDL